MGKAEAVKSGGYVASVVSDFPGYICLEVTNSCNLRCVQCNYQGTTSDHYVGKAGLIDVDFAKKILVELGENKCAVMLNGDGESLLHPRFLEIAEFAMAQNLPSVYFNTNATRLDKHMADELVRFFKGSIQLSLDGFKESHERLRVGSNYDVTVGNVDYLRQRIKETGAPISLVVSYCRYDQPQGEKEQFIDYWLDRVDMVSTGVVWDDEYRLCSGAEEGYDPKQRLQCGVAWQTLIVRWNGLVIPCSNCFTKGYDGYFIMGDANTQSLKEIWRGQPFHDWRVRMEESAFENTVCDSCDRWKMFALFDDEIKDDVRIKRSGMFSTYSKVV
jgi:radical SAM protein with 4Fe4S-binding SPASM domain